MRPSKGFTYGFSTRRAARLAQHLRKLTDMALGVDRIRRILHRSRYSIQWPKHAIRGKRGDAKFERAKAEPKGLRRSSPEPMEC